MTKNENKANAALETVTNDIKIDKNDLLAVAVSKAEMYMRRALADTTKQLKQLEQALQEARTDLGNKVEALAAKLAKPVVQKLEAAKQAAGSQVTIKTNCEMNRDKRTFTVHVFVETSGGWCSRVTFATLYGDFDAAATAVAERLEADARKLDETRATAVDWRKRLAQIPALERQYRARLAEATLSKTEQGRALLETLGNQFEQDALLLPNV